MKKKISAILLFYFLLYHLLRCTHRVLSRFITMTAVISLLKKNALAKKRRRLVLKVAVNSINIIRRLTNCNG